MTTADTTLVFVDALRTVFASALPSQFALSVGPPPGGDVPNEYAAVAYGGDDRPDVISGPSEKGWGNRTQQHSEEITVWCVVSTAGGDQDGRAQLAVTSGYLQAVKTAIKIDPTLGGIIDAGGYASFGAHEWLIDNGGAIATVFFQVIANLPWVD